MTGAALSASTDLRLPLAKVWGGFLHLDSRRPDRRLVARRRDHRDPQLAERAHHTRQRGVGRLETLVVVTDRERHDVHRPPAGRAARVADGEHEQLRQRLVELALGHDAVGVDDGDRQQVRTVALPDYPVIWALVEGIRSTLAGDLATLKRYYQVSFDGGERKWQLTLRPADPRMLEVVSEIRIGGSRSEISLIEIIEAGGDRSVMSIAREEP